MMRSTTSEDSPETRRHENKEPPQTQVQTQVQPFSAEDFEASSGISSLGLESFDRKFHEVVESDDGSYGRHGRSYSSRGGSDTGTGPAWFGWWFRPNLCLPILLFSMCVVMGSLYGTVVVQSRTRSTASPPQAQAQAQAQLDPQVLVVVQSQQAPANPVPPPVLVPPRFHEQVGDFSLNMPVAPAMGSFRIGGAPTSTPMPTPTPTNQDATAVTVTPSSSRVVTAVTSMPSTSPTDEPILILTSTSTVPTWTHSFLPTERTEAPTITSTSSSSSSSSSSSTSITVSPVTSVPTALPPKVSATSGVFRLSGLLSEGSLSSSSSSSSWMVGTTGTTPTNSNDPSLGHSVSLSRDGHSLAVGIPDHDNGMGDVETYRFLPKSTSSSSSSSLQEWQPYGRLDEARHSSLRRFGWSVQLSADGSRLCVLSSFRKRLGGTSTYVVVYESPAATATATTSETADAQWKRVYYLGEDGYGLHDTSVTLSGDGSTVAVGSWVMYQGNRILVYSDSNHLSNSGNGWLGGGGGRQQGTWEVDGNDAFGDESLALSYDGARLVYHEKGRIRTYDRDPDDGTWNPFERDPAKDAPWIGGYDPNGNGNDSSVRLSDDGTRLTVTTPTVLQMYTYTYTSSTLAKQWTPFGRPLYPENDDPINNNQYNNNQYNNNQYNNNQYNNNQYNNNNNLDASRIFVPSSVSVGIFGDSDNHPNNNNNNEPTLLLAVATRGTQDPTTSTTQVRLYTYVHEYDGWIPEDRHGNGNGGTFDGTNLPQGYGSSVAMSADGRTLAIGAPSKRITHFADNDNDNDNDNDDSPDDQDDETNSFYRTSGMVLVYRRDG